jgi:hypothetical protein
MYNISYIQNRPLHLSHSLYWMRLGSNREPSFHCIFLFVNWTRPIRNREPILNVKVVIHLDIFIPRDTFSSLSVYNLWTIKTSKLNRCIFLFIRWLIRMHFFWLFTQSNLKLTHNPIVHKTQHDTRRRHLSLSHHRLSPWSSTHSRPGCCFTNSRWRKLAVSATYWTLEGR